jgi:negative regulator of flagellin synthesis FlgM
MTSPINNLSGSLYVQTTEGRTAGVAAEKRPAPSAPASGSEDRNEVGEASRQAMAAPDFDEAKVQAIRQAIVEGRYPLDPKRIAESFVALEAMLGPVGK